MPKDILKTALAELSGRLKILDKERKELAKQVDGLSKLLGTPKKKTRAKAKSKRKPMSKAQKKAHSLRMKQYWAEKKQGKKR